MNEIVRDGGIKSRKLWFSIFAILVILGGGVTTALWAPLGPMYDTMVGGVVAIAGLYLSGNIAQKWVGSKVPAQIAVSKAAIKAEEVPEEEEASK